jgi:hypothetical protein
MASQVCAPWITPADLCCDVDGTTIDCATGLPTPLVYPWTDDDLILAASNILFARTCFLYPGVCTATVWPCIDRCNGQSYPCARCCDVSTVELPTDYPVISIVAVTEDGVTLDPSTYRIERTNHLVRTDGLPWQRNTFGLTTCSPDSVETTIEYTFGAAPPIELKMAVGELVCELKKACNGADCGLPAPVKALSRRGVSIELTDLTELLKSGATGLPLVDHALSVHGRCGETFHDPAKGMRGWSVS